MTREELLHLLVRLRQARVGEVRVPHKPLLLLWLFGRFAANDSSVATYEQAEEPVSRLINEFGPPVANPSAARQRAAMPFVHLERELWDLRDGLGREIGPDAPERRAWLGELICDAVDLDVAALNAVGTPVPGRGRLSARRSGFAEEVLRAYAYQCAMCGFDGALGRTPVGIEAAHVRWHSQNGPDEVANALALCALHHALLDLGVLGITADRRICVSRLYVARSDAGRAVDALAGRPLLASRPGQPAVDPVYVTWHQIQVFKGGHPRQTHSGAAL